MGMIRQANDKTNKEAKAQDEKTRERERERYDRKNRVKECHIKPGDRALIKQEKTTVRPLYDPKPYEVTEVKGAQVTCRRGGKEKKRPKEKIKIVEERPEYLTTRGQTHRDTQIDEDTEVEINLTPEEENPWDDVEGVGHPQPIQIIDITDEENETNDVDSEEEEFNDSVRITDEVENR